jgi:hypothetical protein
MYPRERTTRPPISTAERREKNTRAKRKRPFLKTYPTTTTVRSRSSRVAVNLRGGPQKRKRLSNGGVVDAAADPSDVTIW